MSDQNVEIARRMLEAFRRRDVKSVLQGMDSEVSFFAPTAVYAGRTDAYRGHESIRAYFDDVERVWEELKVDPQEFREGDGCVVATGTMKGRLRNGDSFEALAGWVWRFQNGKITSWRVYTDPSEALSDGGLAE